MKIIVCTGDSHTWGQGAQGACDGFATPLMGGDLRPVAWGSNGYVNLLRRRFGAVAQQWEAGQCAGQWQVPLDAFGAVMSGTHKLPSAMRLVRLFFYDNAEAHITLTSGGNRRELLLRNAGCPNAWREVCLPLDGRELTMVVSGKASLYRAEWYGGDAAVINSGVGSTTCGRYAAEYMDEKVSAFTPYAVLAEAHTVNNWLTGQAPSAYREELTAYLKALLDVTPRVSLLTVAPVLGSTVNSAGIEYDAYVEASREAAATVGVPLIDAYSAFAADWSQFDDIWHPNDAGHSLYAQAAAPTLENWLENT